MRGRQGQFPEYHTSGDNLDFVSADRMLESLGISARSLRSSRRRVFRNLAPFGEPQLGTRGLYRALGGTDIPNLQMAMLWVLNQCDGELALLDIARRAGLDFRAVRKAADSLVEHGLLVEEPRPGPSGDLGASRKFVARLTTWPRRQRVALRRSR